MNGAPVPPVWLRSLPGKLLMKTRDGNNNWQVWEERTMDEISLELNTTRPAVPRIISVKSTHDRKQTLPRTDDQKALVKESFEEFALNDGCRRYMTETLHFPTYLFNASWYKSNGFAGSKRLLAPNGNICWFRVLVKWVCGMEKYRWHEMTFFIHQLDEGIPTVVMFEVPDDTMPDPNPTSVQPPIDQTKQYLPFNFISSLADRLNAEALDYVPDWRFLQAILLEQTIGVVDRAVWACSKAVRKLENTRPATKYNLSANFDFPLAHDLLRHALHLKETLKTASDTLYTYTAAYETQQKQHLKTLVPPIALADDDPLPAESRHESLAATLQLLTNLSHRSASNEDRLRNEISLAFNLVSQADTRAMRIISIVTLLFLPATFVSTLFSMSFFNYGVVGEGDVLKWSVSPKAWIYGAVSVPLTIAAVAAWIWGARVWEKWGEPVWRWLKGEKEKDE